jgi:hypothetical protein
MDGWRVRVAVTEIDDTDYIGEGRLDTVSSWAGVMSPQPQTGRLKAISQ